MDCNNKSLHQALKTQFGGMADAHNSANRNTGGVILAIASLVLLLVIFNLTSSNIKLTDFESLEAQLTTSEKNQKDSLKLLSDSELIVKKLGEKKIVDIQVM